MNIGELIKLLQTQNPETPIKVENNDKQDGWDIAESIVKFVLTFVGAFVISHFIMRIRGNSY
jgi:hypothetical protein